MNRPASNQHSLIDRIDHSEFVLGDTTIVGRHEDCHLVLKSESGASRKHARITIENGNAILIDLGSLNGTTVNGIEISRPVQLVDGDVLVFDEREYLFKAPTSSDAGRSDNITIIANKDEIGRPDRIRPAIRVVETNAMANAPASNDTSAAKPTQHQHQASQVEPIQSQVQDQASQVEPIQSQVAQPEVAQPEVAQPRAAQRASAPASQTPVHAQRVPKPAGPSPVHAQQEPEPTEQVPVNAQHEPEPTKADAAESQAFNQERVADNASAPAAKPSKHGITAIPATSRPGGDNRTPVRLRKQPRAAQRFDRSPYSTSGPKPRWWLWAIVFPLVILVMLAAFYFAYNAGFSAGNVQGTNVESS